MRVAAGVFAGIFLVGAIVQWNDPDPMLWILGYAVAAGLSLAACLGRPSRVGCAVAALVFGLWFVRLAPSLRGAPEAAFTSFRMQASAHEEPREAVGLALLSGWNLSLAIWSGRRRASSRAESQDAAVG